ncbi:hypothetical protein EXIGLDRAFT_225215 [Exidia glandulosa HHB12029]|uniref:Uncharacterized protein n=1 Tax=Exidia glandulosa HHB12029 TaxID=1314781 RepID=A0A165E9Z4_EXIGL|nr:hypothetical protein EXIGLDRAFT_225215 [Exidia glandulosa HHB12029]
MDLLPVYTALRTSGGTKHTFRHDSNLTVHVFSHAASSSSSPIFHDESRVAGVVEVTMKKGPFTAIKCITVQVRGFQRLMRCFGYGAMDSDAVEFLALQHTFAESDLASQARGRLELPFELQLGRLAANIRSAGVSAVHPVRTRLYSTVQVSSG